jgi:hypothetical protein
MRKVENTDGENPKSVKAVIILTAAIALGALGFVRFAPKAPHPETAAALSPPVSSAPHEMLTLRTGAEAVEIFQRAFWRQPTAEDRILHAERREWVSEKDGVRRWQWFLVVEPGTALSSWLRDQNPFNLTKVDLASVAAIDSPPSWFPASAELIECEIQQAADGAMTFTFDPKRNRLYATDAGGGFAVVQSK